MGTETEGLRLSMINWCQGHTAESDGAGNQCLFLCAQALICMQTHTPTLKLNFITHKNFKYVYIHKKVIPQIFYFIFM